MVIPDFRVIRGMALVSEIYHYGMPERSGRYAWGTGDRPYQRLEGKASRMESRLRKRFSSVDDKTSKMQSRANKLFDKAGKQRNSRRQSTRDKSQKTFDKGYDIWEKKGRVEYSMDKMYQRYLKRFESLDLTMDDDLKAKGLEYYNRVFENTNSQYKMALLKRIS